jgi:pyruvate/2-oxoglutarate dehydrogenase complex dihydrolipoamide dehydrogenase (E3) component
VVGASDGSVIAMVDGQQRQFAAGSVVVAIGRVPNAGLADELEQAGFRVQVVGDAVEPRHMQAAVYEGAEASGVVGGV